MKPGTKKGRRFVKRLLALGSVSALAMLAGTSMSSLAASKSEVEAQRLLKAAELRFGMTAAQAAGFFDTANLPKAQVELLKTNLEELRALTPDQINGLLGYFEAAQGETGGTGQTVARWIQMAPGSSTNALVSGNYGDQPTSVFPTILARAIVSGGACPVVHLDGGLTWPLRVRFTGSSLTNVPGTAGATNAKAGYPQYFVQNTTPQNFPNGTPMATTSWTECESALPFGYHTATIDGVDLALPKAKPTRFLVLADTGCRMAGALAANGANQQNCSDPTTFPLAYLANLEATFKPDLIVHVGDYFYRDTNCNNTFPGCADTTSANYEMYGDTFDSWNADLLFPAKSLLAAAPWIMTRGNHESCGRGARGWYALLDPHPYDFSKVSCAPSSPAAPSATAPNYTADFEPTYVVGTPGLNFLVHDSSLANDTAVATALAQNYDVDLTNLLAAVGKKSMNIFTTHKPSFGLDYGEQSSSTPSIDSAGDYTLQAAVAGGTYAASAFAHGVPKNVGLFLSGHIHAFQYVNFNNNELYAPQLIVGMGGSLLDADLNTGIVPANGTLDPAAYTQSGAEFAINQVSGSVIDAIASKTYGHDEFGFAVLDAKFDTDGSVKAFDAAVYKVSSTLAGHCTIKLRPNRSIACDF